jgi:2-oxoisovalerate dehydrogenase E1 component
MAKKNTILKEKNQISTSTTSFITSILYQGQEHELELYSKFDFSGYKKERIIQWYKLNHLGRKLDEKASLYLKMAKGWSYHAPFGGHDGIQLALGQIFRPSKDYLFPYYRDLMTVLSAGISPEEIILNGLSKDTDVAGGGRHMSNHFAKPSINIQNVSSCVSNHSLHAVGLARAIKKFNGDEIVFASFGESSTSEGYFYEAINGATLEKLPVIFVIQNNGYGISVPVTDQSANTRISDNLVGFKNLKIINCDGRDPFDSFNALKQACDYVASGQGAAVVHASCDRIGSHSNSDRHEIYRSEDELKSVKRRDPLLQFRYHILNDGILTETEILKIEEDNRNVIFQAADLAEAAPDADGSKWSQYIVPAAYFEDKNFNENNSDIGEKVNLIHSINDTLKKEFRKNKKTFLWGQDISKGGVFNVVKGMPEEFGRERVFNSPIAEDSIVGTANGFTRYDPEIRVVIEGAEFADYFWPAMEQLVESSHDYWRTNGQFSPNFVIRLASGGYIQGGLYHSQNLEGTFITLPGIRIVQPAFADDAAGLLRNAIRSKGITLFLEPKYLYNFKQASTSLPPDDYIIPFGKARIRRTGKDITIITYGTAVHLSLFAADELAKEGIDVEVIDLRSLAPWDKETVFESVKKTNKVIVAHEDKIIGGVGGEIVSEIQKNCFKFLDTPIIRVGSKFSPVGFAKNYEKIILPNQNDIKQAVLEVVKF